MYKDCGFCNTLQACTEMVMPMCTDGVHDMFFNDPVSDTRVISQTHANTLQLLYLPTCISGIGVLMKPNVNNSTG